MTSGGAPLLTIENLRVEFPTDDGPLHAVDGLSVDVHEHEVLGLVGESGSGKTVAALAILGLLPTRAQRRRLGPLAGPRAARAQRTRPRADPR